MRKLELKALCRYYRGQLRRLELNAAGMWADHVQDVRLANQMADVLRSVKGREALAAVKAWERRGS